MEGDKKALAWEFVMRHFEHATRMTYEEEAPEGTHETVRRLGGWYHIGTRWSLANMGFLRRDFYDLFTCESEMPLLAQRQIPQIGDIPNLKDGSHVNKVNGRSERGGTNFQNALLRNSYQVKLVILLQDRAS